VHQRNAEFKLVLLNNEKSLGLSTTDVVDETYLRLIS
jgi:hypothetical protein